MISEITTALATAKTAFDLAKSIHQLTSDVKINQIVIELQQSILGLQSEVMAVHGKMEDLARIKNEVEQKLVEYQQWQDEKERYFLNEIASGIFVYALKPGDQRGEPSHYLCPHCFQNEKKSFLQRPSPDHSNYKCHSCQFEMTPTKYIQPRDFVPEQDYLT